MEIEQLTSKPDFLLFKKVFCTYIDIFFGLLPMHIILYFLVKIQLFMTEKSDQDPNPGPHEFVLFGFLDPDPVSNPL